MKTILHYVHSLNIGGGSLHVEKITTDLSKDYVHLVIGCSGTYENNLKDMLGDNLFVGNLLTIPFILLKLLLTRKIDVLHFHGRMAGVIGRVSTIFNNVSKIYTIHGFSYESDGFFKRNLFSVFEKMLVHVTDYIVFVSMDEKKLYNKMITPYHEDKKIVIFNYQDPIKVESREIEKIDSIKMLFIGRMSHQKGVDILLNAISRVDAPFSIDLIGDGPSFEEYRRLAKRLKLEKCVFLGAVKNASKLINNYDLLVIPSRYEGMPYIMIEGVSAQIPIVCTPARGICEFLNNTNSYCAKGTTVEALSDVLTNFCHDRLENVEKVERVIKKANFLMVDEFNKEVQLNKIKNLYSK